METQITLLEQINQKLCCIYDKVNVASKDYEQINRTVWNDAGNGEELIQYVKLENGVIIETKYTYTSGVPYNDPVVNPTSIRAITPKTPIHGEITGSGGSTTLVIPASLHYGIHVDGGGDITSGANTLVDDAILEIPPRIDGQAHPAVTYDIPDNVTIVYNYLPL